MRARRPPSLPPAIDGHDYVRLIGSGGFADVFLYEEHRPRRQVAIKVLLPQRADDAARRAFAAEADLMASVSSHPSIVTIFDSDVTADGRVYLAMEYCSGATMSTRYKTEPLGVAETLRVGIQIAGAVETAHRKGIVHRDIKPANILVTDYGHPALTDFGISATIEQSEAGADGVSVPWSPPENFAPVPRSGVTSDVWSLAATLYTLLAGRSPFEVPGGDNSQRALVTRIRTELLPPIGRDDVPAALERVLAVAMEKAPETRYASMLDLARQLQRVQSGLHLVTTPIDIIDGDGPALLHTERLDDDDTDGTRVRVASDRVTGYGTPSGSLRAGGTEADGLGRTADSVSGSSGSTSYGFVGGVPYLLDAPEHSGTTGDASTGSVPTGSAPTGSAAPAGAGWPAAPATPTSRTHRRGRRRALATATAAVLVVAGGLTARQLALPETLAPSDVPSPAALAADAHGRLTVFTWTNPDPQDGDVYAYRRIASIDGVATTAYRETRTLTTSVNSPVTDPPCLEVVLVRGARTSAEPARTCLE